MQLINAFRRLPLSIQITWILAAAFVLLLAIPTYLNSDFASDNEASRKERGIERASDGNASTGRRERRPRYGPRDDLSDQNYGSGDDDDPLSNEGTDRDDESREFEKDFDDTREDDNLDDN